MVSFSCWRDFACSNQAALMSAMERERTRDFSSIIRHEFKEFEGGSKEDGSATAESRDQLSDPWREGRVVNRLWLQEGARTVQSKRSRFRAICSWTRSPGTASGSPSTPGRAESPLSHTGKYSHLLHGL